MRKPVAPCISVDERGIAYIDGTETKVLTVIQNKRLSRETPEQLRSNMPHLSFSQVFAALAYYQGHREDVEKQIRALDDRAARILANQPSCPSRSELLARRAERQKQIPTG